VVASVHSVRTMGGGLSRSSTDEVRQQENHLSDDEEDDDDAALHLVPRVWMNRSLHKLVKGEFVEAYRSHQEEQQCCRWCHDCHDDALSLHCLCRSHRINLTRLEKALLKRPRPSPMEILMDNQLCDFSSTNPSGTARFMGLARQTHFVGKRDVVLHLDQQIRRRKISEARKLKHEAEIQKEKAAVSRKIKAREAMEKRRRDRHKALETEDEHASPQITARSQSSFFGALSARFSPKKSPKPLPRKDTGDQEEYEQEEEEAAEAEEEEEAAAAEEEEEGANVSLDTSSECLEADPLVLPVFRTMDNYARIPLHTLCLNEQVTPEMLETIIKPWPTSVTITDANGCSCMHHLCSNRAVTCSLIKVLLDAMSTLADERASSHQKELKGVTLLTYLRVWNDQGELPLHRLCSNPSVYPEVLTLLLDSDSVAAGCRNDRGIAPMHLLASNPACSVETLDVLFPVSNIVYDSPKFDDRPKFVKPGFKPNVARLQFGEFKGNHHVMVSYDTFGRSILHRLCRNDHATTTLIEWVLAKEMLPAGSQLPPPPLGLCYGPHDKPGPRGRGRYLLSRFVEHFEGLEPGVDPWQAELAREIVSEMPQTMMRHRDYQGQTPLHMACETEFDPPQNLKKRSLMSRMGVGKDPTSAIEKLRLLVMSAPENCGAKDAMGRTPLHVLCANPSLTSALLLKTLKISALAPASRVRDACERLPLHSLCLNSAMAAVKARDAAKMLRALIRQNKKAAHMVDMYGCTPLHYLCMRGRPTRDQVKIFLKVAPMAARISDETGRVASDSIWLNAHMSERQIASLSDFLETMRLNMGANVTFGEENDEDFAVDSDEDLKDTSDDASDHLKTFKMSAIGEEGEEGATEEEDAGESDDSDQDYPHSLVVRIVRAENLAAKDRGGTSDPFACLLVDGRRTRVNKTITIPKTLDPVWDAEFNLDCDFDKSVVDIVLYDEDKVLLGLKASAEFLGAVSVALTEAEDGEKWYELGSDARYQEKPEGTVTGRILMSLQGINQYRQSTLDAKANSESALRNALTAKKFRTNFLAHKAQAKAAAEAAAAAEVWRAQHEKEEKLKDEAQEKARRKAILSSMYKERSEQSTPSSSTPYSPHHPRSP
jgi:hypothetical protein